MNIVSRVNRICSYMNEGIVNILKEEPELNKQANSQSKFEIKTLIIQAHSQRLEKYYLQILFTRPLFSCIG